MQGYPPRTTWLPIQWDSYKVRCQLYTKLVNQILNAKKIASCKHNQCLKALDCRICGRRHFVLFFLLSILVRPTLTRGDSKTKWLSFGKIVTICAWQSQFEEERTAKTKWYFFYFLFFYVMLIAYKIGRQINVNAIATKSLKD